MKKFCPNDVSQEKLVKKVNLSIVAYNERIYNDWYDFYKYKSCGLVIKNAND
jgi:hypothetical protein